MKRRLGIKHSLILLVLFAFLFQLLLEIRTVWPFTIDDMYISLRYAKHWVAGHGVSWNIGEKPVEGYSNFSFVALAALALRLQLDPVVVLKSLGVIGLGFTALGVYCLTRFWFSSLLAIIPCIWMLLYQGQIIWAVSGLETTIYQALLTFSLYFLLRGMGYQAYPGSRQDSAVSFFILAGLMLSLAAMTRFEAPIIALTWFVLVVCHPPQQGKQIYFKRFLKGFLSWIIVFLPYFLWRWHYFGRLFPNPVYCKGVSDYSLKLDLNYLSLVWPFILLAMPSIIKARDRLHYFFWLPSLIYLALLVKALPISVFENRLFLPAYILLLPLSMRGLAYLVHHYFPKNDEVFHAAFLGCAFFIAFFFIPTAKLSDYRNFMVNPQAGDALRYDLLNWLNRNVSNDSRIVLGDCGLIPYLSQYKFIDSYCLNNREMTAVPYEAMYEWGCQKAFAERPEVIILAAETLDNKMKYAPTDQCLREKIAESRVYQLRTIFRSVNEEGDYRYEVFTVLH